jgi:HD-like signal output (HDOD) protein
MTDTAIPRLDLQQVLSVAQLPALPQSAIRLLELSQDPANGPAELAVPIESDPGLTGQVLRFVNSSYFGFSREVSNVKLAITLVGIRTVKNFALWNAVFSLMPNPQCGPFDLKSLWQDSLRRALFSRTMAKMLGIREAEEPFAAALLQDMAVPVLAREAPNLYQKLLQARNGGRLRLSQLEQRLFGWTHAQAAGIMARLWNLPEELATLLENHHAVDRWASRRDTEPGRLAVAISALLPTTVDPTWVESEAFEAYYQQIAPTESPPVVELLGQIDREFADLAPVLKLPTPRKSLAEAFYEIVASRC